MDREAAKARVCEVVDDHAEALIGASHDLHEHPELCFEEHHAHDVLTDLAERAGLDVVRHAHGLETAFMAAAGEGSPTVAVCAEYDALPGIGHACGHNIIGTAGLGAGIAAAAVADALGGRVVVVGTPAEEGGGGKLDLLRAGAFEGVDAAMMVHGAGAELRRMDAIAVDQLLVTCTGRAAHAAAAPHEGRNALDAAVLGYMNVAALRQHIRDDERVHGVFTDGGAKPNIVPDRAQTHWYVRAGTLERLEALKPRVLACLEAGAAAAGCELTHDWIGPRYADVRDNEPLVDLYAANAERLGRRPQQPDPDTRVIGSTDMGDVSYAIPSIHPMIAVAPPGTAIHTEAFAAAAASPAGDAAVLDGAKAMAMTVVDLWADTAAMDSVTSAFAADLGDG